MTLALKAGKIDAILTMDSTADALISQDSVLAAFPESFGEMYMSFALRKNDPMTEQWRTALDKIGEERAKELYDIWTDSDESKKVMPEQDWADNNGT